MGSSKRSRSERTERGDGGWLTTRYRFMGYGLRTVHLLNCADLTVGHPQHVAHEFPCRADAIRENVQRKPWWPRSATLGGQ